MNHSNTARVTVTQGKDNTLIATASHSDEATMGHLLAALNAIPGISNIQRLEQPGAVSFTMMNPPTLGELAEELTAWVA